MSTGKYWLGQSAWSATRLRLQHELTKTNFNNRLLDPAIALQKENLTIADVATGTGAWCLDFHEKHPDNTIEGLDVNLNEVPPKKWLPGNVSFHYLDLLKEVPEEFVGRYDIVHMQYAVLFVRDREVEGLLGTLMRMLKPGGYLQWGEAHPLQYIFHAAEGKEKAPAARRLHDLQSQIHPSAVENWTYLDNMPARFQAAGFQDVVFVQPEPKPSTLQPIMMNWLWALEEGFEGVVGRFPEKREVLEVSRRLREGEVMREVRELGVGLDMRMRRCIGRKPLATE
ncbi:hypothetical protein M409DRAFT_16607 [Zasmidium cellare ATCC 36951]|uniref:Methyltransferase domain-containing protein n=1 Tax=Zasmidium cellare ATCC 36951 TaxID=1080233 RepID=A0A6A6D0D6_ZASCE|nr:uncharacterized protein M409DRAFT_16607 [Zasmidium cellare ATCC 36951]KAF2172645.1 hypothetical protein M409DRAFT_16607 [Zasmidium cellare ATCC 36951]